MGGLSSSVKCLDVVKLDSALNLILISGSVHGPMVDWLQFKTRFSIRKLHFVQSLVFSYK